MRSLCLGLCLFIVIVVHAQGQTGTSYGAALQVGDPAMLTTTHHTLNNALAGAVLQNQGKLSIVSYKIGWVVVKSDHMSVHEGPSMNVPSGVAPGSTADVPDQAIPLDNEASSFTFYVSEVTYADGTKWSADAQAMLKRIQGR